MSLPWWCDCCVWVEAGKCSGNSSDARVFVHEDNLPESTGVFAFLSSDTTTESGRNCWTINPADKRVVIPNDDNVYFFGGDPPYTSCSECKEDTDEPDGPGGGGGGGGGDPGDSKGIKVTVCSGHEERARDLGLPLNRLYVSRDEPFASSFTTMQGGVCFRVPSGPVTTPPDDAVWLSVGGSSYETCSDCTDGVKARLCSDDENLPEAEDAPEFWVRKSDLDEAPDGFDYGVWCYEVPSGPLQTIPANATIFRPTTDVSCAGCNRGVQYQLCPGESDPGKAYWAEQSAIDDLAADIEVTRIYMRIDGVCYSLDLTAGHQRIPLDAGRVVPRCLFASCDACACSGGLDPACFSGEGVPLRLCPDQDQSRWVDTWMPQEKLPSQLTWFIHNSYCVYVDPDEPISRIPDDAEVVIAINNVQANCSECRANCPTCGGPTILGPGAAGFDPYPPPWQDPDSDPPPPPPDTTYQPLSHCGGDNTYDGYYLRNRKILPQKVGSVISKDDGCYTVGAARKTLPDGALLLPVPWDFEDDCDVCCGDCYFSDTSTIDVDEYYSDCYFFGNTNCSGDAQYGDSSRMITQGTLSKTGDHEWSGTVTRTGFYDQFFNGPGPCPATTGAGPPSEFSMALKYNCDSNRWYKSVFGSSWVPVGDGTNDTGCDGVQIDSTECFPAGNSASYTITQNINYTVSN